MDTIGERIVFLREERDISQKALALTIDLTAATLSRYENNIYEPKADIICRLTKALDTNADFLLGLEADYSPRSANSPRPGLTPQEHRMLRYYRELSTANRTRIDERILTLRSLEQEAEKKLAEQKKQIT